MIRRRVTEVVIVVAMVAAACSGSDSIFEDQATPAVDPGRCIGGELTADPLDSEDAGEVEPDPQLQQEVLDNGLTVYVRENDSPGQRGQLSLVVRAGSALESEGQSGAAHFLEHMLFNGTERWPGNELTQELERFGSEMGADLNAWTDFDETVYVLDLPAVDEQTLELAVDVLFEWAARATLEQSAVEDERGVILEERRLRAESPGGRIFESWAEFVLEGSPYEDHASTVEVEPIETMDREPLLEFYEDWYQPELMAVVAVGDFDGADMADLIEDRFNSLDRDGGPDRTDFVVEPWTTPRYLAVHEPDETLATGSVFFPVVPPASDTGQGRREQLIHELALDLISTRISNEIARGAVRLLDVRSSDGSPVTSLAAPSIDFEANSKDLREATAAVIAEMERVCRFGFNVDEFDRAINERRTTVETQFAGTASRQDVDFGAEYQQAFLVGSPTPTSDKIHELNLTLLDSVSADDVTAWFSGLYGSSAPSVFAAGPNEADLPTAAQLEELASAASSLELEPTEQVDVSGLELMERPAPAEISARTSFEEFESTGFDAVELEFANGARVFVQQSTIATGLVQIGAASPGGLSVLPAEDVVAGQMLTDIVTESGVGTFDQVTLTSLLADRDVDLDLWVSPEEEHLAGGGASEDLETLLQLVHLYMTEPRATDAAVAIAVGETLPVALDPSTDSDAAIFSALTDLRYGGEIRYAWPPNPQDLEALPSDQVQRVAEDRFARSGDFVFVIVGDFELGDAEELAASYLGTLPGAEPETWVDLAPSPPAGAELRTVTAGSGDQGQLLLLYTDERTVDSESRLVLPVLETVVATRLREVIREDLAATYSPSVISEVSDQPDELIEMFISVEADPERLAELSAIIKTELAGVAAGEISDDELARAIETVANDYELWSNGTLIDMHHFYALHPTEDLIDFLTRDVTVRQVDKEQVAGLAASLFDPDRHIEIQLEPERP
jgi:zinc protease